MCFATNKDGFESLRLGEETEFGDGIPQGYITYKGDVCLTNED